MAHDEQWLTPRLQTAATLCNQTPAATESPLWLGVDLGTCDVVSMVVDRDGQPVAVCLDWADVVRDGIVWDFFGAVTIVRRHLDTLEQQFGLRFSHAATSFPPGTDPRIPINVLESAGLEVSHVLDEPTAMLDPVGRQEVISTVQRLNQQQGITVINITHFMEEAALSDRVLVMKQGKLAQEGKPEEIFQNIEAMKKLGLDVPVATELAYRLQKKGLPITKAITNQEALIEALCQLK